jgi:hypothetical protein
VAIHVSTRGARPRQDEEARHGRGSPAESLVGDPGPESDLRVVPAEQLLDRRQLGLHLDDEEGRRGLVPSQQVDRAIFSEMGIGHLGNDRPSEPREFSSDRPDERCVRLVEHPVDLPASPSDLQFRARPDRPENAPQAPERHGLEVPSLDQRHDGLAHAGPLGDVHLTPIESNSEHPHQSTNVPIVHLGEYRDDHLRADYASVAQLRGIRTT